MRAASEQCDDCSSLRARCANHIACDTRADAGMAAHIGAGWAEFVKGQVDVRQPWPDFSGRCAAIATRLVSWLADDDRTRRELARICWWRAGMRWEFLHSRNRDRPYEPPSGKGVVLSLPGSCGLHVHFRTRRKDANATFTAADYPWKRRRPAGTRG